MNHIEAMKQALEALEHSHAKEPMWKTPIKNAIASLRQAIAEAEKQEPAMRIDWWPSADTERYVVNMIEWNRLPVGTLLYTTPQPQREWVGLTDEEVYPLANKHLHYQIEGYEVSGIYDLAQAIEAKLKEKNSIKGEA
jgi:hypothetical protein